MINHRFFTVMCVLLTVGMISVVHADPFVDAIVAFEPGSGAGFGQSQMPDIVLGPPRGAGLTGGSLDVLSLGDGGSITLEFVDNIALNGPGPDLIVFENAFFLGGDPLNVFAEVAFVEVSQDGVTFYRFPNHYDPDGTPVNNPDNWTGFAGVQPVLSHPENGIDPTDPDVAGGDVFELDEVGLDWIRFVRIIDTDEGENAAMDDYGNVIYDPGMPGGTSAGFDLDAVAAVHSISAATPTPTTTPATGTPAPTHTPTPTATPSGEPTATPLPDFRFTLILSSTHFEHNDEFLLQTIIDNAGPVISNASQYVILDVYSDYFFYPSWSREPDADETDVPVGRTETTILQFFWPEVAGHADGLIIWGGIVSETRTIVGNVDWVEFGY